MLPKTAICSLDIARDGYRYGYSSCSFWRQKSSGWPCAGEEETLAELHWQPTSHVAVPGAAPERPGLPLLTADGHAYNQVSRLLGILVLSCCCPACPGLLQVTPRLKAARLTCFACRNKLCMAVMQPLLL